MKKLLLCSVVLLHGCVFSSEVPQPLHDKVFVTIDLVDSITDRPGASGIATYRSTGICTVEIRRDVYPACITHEILHCFSGDWHQGRETTEFCSE